MGGGGLTKSVSMATQNEISLMEVETLMNRPGEWWIPHAARDCPLNER